MIIAKTIDITTVSPSVERNNRPIFVGDKNALSYQFTLQNVTGSASVKAYGIRADGETVLVDGESLGGNTFAVKISAPFTAVPGRLQLVVKALVSGTEIVTIYAADMVVVNTTTDTIVDPSRVIPSLDELLAQIETISAATSAANAAAAKVSKMTIHGSVSDHFEVQSGLNSQGGIDINILGGVGVKGDKGDKGDAGGIQSVNGVQPSEEGELTITGADIPGTQMDLLWEGEQEVKSGNVFNLGVDARDYKALFAVLTRSTNMRGHMMFTADDVVGTALIGSTYYTERVYTASIVLNWSSDYKSFTPTVGGSYYNGGTSVTYEKIIKKIYGMR